MTDYLVHFNRIHNPKTGRFDFGDGDGDGQTNDRLTMPDTARKEKYSGLKRSEYIKNMKAKYKASGYNSIKSNRYARTAAEQNRYLTNKYNKNLKKMEKQVNEANAAYKQSGGGEQYQKKLSKFYNTALETSAYSFLLNHDYEMGRDFSVSFFDIMTGNINKHPTKENSQTLAKLYESRS